MCALILIPHSLILLLSISLILFSFLDLCKHGFLPHILKIQVLDRKSVV